MDATSNLYQCSRIDGVDSGPMTTATGKTELRALEQARRRALVEEDYSRVAQLFADDRVYLHTAGVVQGKSEYLGYAKNAGEPQGCPAFVVLPSVLSGVAA